MHPENTPDWLPERKMYHFTDISPTTTALLVIDMQVVFVEEGQPGAGLHSSSIVPNINSLSKAIRSAGGLVVFTRHTVADYGPRVVPEWQLSTPAMARLAPFFRVGKREHDVDASMDRQPGDLVLDKYRLSAFTYNSSELQEALQARGINTVIVTGVVTNACCETTARDAFMIGYKTFFVADGTAAYSNEEHNAALLSLSTIFADVRKTQEIVDLLKGNIGPSPT